MFTEKHSKIIIIILYRYRKTNSDQTCRFNNGSYTSYCPDVQCFLVPCLMRGFERNAIDGFPTPRLGTGEGCGCTEIEHPARFSCTATRCTAATSLALYKFDRIRLIVHASCASTLLCTQYIYAGIYRYAV